KLPSLKRLRRARRFVNQIQPFIATVQGSFEAPSLARPGTEASAPTTISAPGSEADRERSSLAMGEAGQAAPRPLASGTNTDGEGTSSGNQVSPSQRMDNATDNPPPRPA